MYYKCQNCGKKLTDPESVKRGYGPECWDRITGTQVQASAPEEEQVPGQMDIMDYLGGTEDAGKKNLPGLQ